jgi:hypothetical protein
MFENTTDTDLDPRTFKPLADHKDAVYELRKAHALEAIAGALCRLDHRIADFMERDLAAEK